MLLQKTRKKKTDGEKKIDYLEPGKPLTSEEFISLVREADASGYISSEEFKKNAWPFFIPNKGIKLRIE